MPAGEKTKTLWLNPQFRKRMSDVHKGQGVIHGHAKRNNESRLYSIWMGMIARCRNKNDPRYKRYGGRGIKIEWESFLQFEHDMGKSYEKHLKIHGKTNTTIDRINNDGNYSKPNCRWATRSEQNFNRPKRINCKQGHKIEGLDKKSGTRFCKVCKKLRSKLALLKSKQ